MQRRPLVLVLLTAALHIVGNLRPAAVAADSSKAGHDDVDLASRPYSIQKSDRLEAIKRYILTRLNVSESRRFNRSASAPPPTTTHHQPASRQHDEHRQSQQLTPTQSFSSMPEALNYYAKQLAEDGRRRGRARTRVDEGVQRRRRRLHVDEAGGTEPRKRGSSRRRSSRKRRQRRQIKLTMTADTGQIAYSFSRKP